MGYETPSTSKPIGTATASSHPPVATRQRGSHDCPDGGGGAEVGVALGANLPGKGTPWLTRPAHSGASVISSGRAEDPLGPSVTARGTRRRVPDRIVDVGAHRQGDLARVPRALSAQCLMVSLARPGVELSKAPAARLPAQRSRDCALEALPLAAYKKRQHASGRTWFSWTKVASCSSPT